MPGIMGTIQANQALGILLGKGTPLIGRLLVFNGFDNTFDEVRFRKNNSRALSPTLSAPNTAEVMKREFLIK